MFRTHTCGELGKKDLSKKVQLCGWVKSNRDHGGLIFIDLRDRYGLIQIVFDPSHNKDTHKIAERLGREDVISVVGHVRARKEGMINKKMLTGEIEVLIDQVQILNEADTPPFEIDERSTINEDMRLKYRYLDLRTNSMQKNIITRHKTVSIVRKYLDEIGFLDIETPILGKSTPEGARDYLVPSRVHAGKFYALPQSPQIFKQLLMLSGFDRYYQIARCFRDEDLRADRQPEFTQIDMEMSFIDEEDIYSVIEEMFKRIWKGILGVEIKTPLPRMTYDDAMNIYGSDRPDTRFDLKLIDVGDTIKDSGYKVFADIVAKGGSVKCLKVEKSSFSRKDIDSFIEYVKIYGAKGLTWMKYGENGFESNIVKYFDEKTLSDIQKTTDAKQGDLVLFIGDNKTHIVNTSLGALRLHMGKKLGLIKDTYNFLWVTDFPLVEWDEDEQRYKATHHPFTSPNESDLHLLEKDPGQVKSRAYDLVLNGTELGGGSIRIHTSDLQQRVFRILGISQAEAKNKFGFLMGAFKYGAPPHGGIAFGLDRVCAILTGNESIREVIAFPKTKNVESLMDGSPSPVSAEQLKELHIKADFVEKKVTKTKVTEWLESKAVEFRLLPHSKKVFTVEEAAKERGVSADEMVKTMVVTDGKDYYLMCLPGPKKLNLEKVSKLIGREVKLADSKEIKKITGYDEGAISPLLIKKKIQVFMDKSFQHKKRVNISSGDPMLGVELDRKILFELLDGTVENLG